MTCAKLKCIKNNEPTKYEYVVMAVYKSTPDERDRKLAKAVGRDSDGSGYFLLTGERDNHWDYKRRVAAEAAVKRIRAAKIRGVKVRLEKVEV